MPCLPHAGGHIGGLLSPAATLRAATLRPPLRRLRRSQCSWSDDMTKMKFGIQTSLNNVEWREIEDMWKFLDRETKFDSAWTFDHFVPPGPGQDANAN